MKFIYAPLYLSIATLVLSEGADDHAPRKLYAYEDACLKSYEISLSGGKCNYEAVAAVMQKAIDEAPSCRQGTKPVDELRAFFYEDGLNDNEIADKVNLACEDAYFDLTYGDGVSYVDIIADSQQQVKEYYDGRGCINTDHELDCTKKSARDEILKTCPMHWPGESIFGYDKQLPSNLKSLFPSDYWARHNGDTIKTDRYGRKSRVKNERGRKAALEQNYYPVQNFNQCSLNTAMCCWTESTDPARVYGEPVSRNITDHNTDICYVNMGEAPTSSRVRAGFAIFPGLSEVQEGSGSVRCHGFSWAEDPMDVSNLFKGNSLFHASFQQHLERGGYVSAISGAPMCGCLEQMPIVTRADCTKVEVADFDIDVSITKADIGIKIAQTSKIEFKECSVPGSNATADLRSYYEHLVDDKMVVNKKKSVASRLVGEGGCTDVVARFFDQNGIHGY